ncbi:hypothetical protein VWZ82_13100 [Phaeobacter sp. JH20_41]|uniref:hypothetical protein n=1 Tax=Phaeobacter sp. JH20_41 TaxID=3112498 RepID=UPI003A86D60F
MRTLTPELRDELRAIAEINDALESAAFQHIRNRPIYDRLADMGFVTIGPAQSTFDPRHFIGVTITDAGRAALLT